MKNDIPDFKSTLSIFPYFLKSLSTSDCLASKSRFPQKMGFIFFKVTIFFCNQPAIQCKNWDLETVKLNEKGMGIWWIIEGRRRSSARIWCFVEGLVPFRKKKVCKWNPRSEIWGKLQNAREREINKVLIIKANTSLHNQSLVLTKTHRFGGCLFSIRIMCSITM